MVKEEAAATEKENNNNNNTQPFLVFLITGFGGNAIVYGLLGAIYAPILGRSFDVHGRKKVLLLSHGGTLNGWVIF